MTDEKVLEILKSQYMIENASLKFHRESGGKVYIAETDKKHLLKIFGKAFFDNAKEAVNVMCYLEENGFPVPKTYYTKTNEPFIEFSIDG